MFLRSVQTSGFEFTSSLSDLQRSFFSCFPKSKHQSPYSMSNRSTQDLYFVEVLLHFQMLLGFPTRKIMPASLLCMSWEHPGNTICIWERKKVFSPFLHLQPSALESVQQSIKLWEISAKISLPAEISEQETRMSYLDEKFLSLLSISVCSKLVSLMNIFFICRHF